MITSPICQTTKATALRARKFKYFLAKYPSAFEAWVERQPHQSDRTFWCAMADPFLLPVIKVLISRGQAVWVPVSSQDLWDCWFRAAVTMLVRPIGDREQGDFTAKELAQAFGIPLSRYQGLVDKERAWRTRPTIKPPKVQRRGLIAGQPDVEDLFVRLIK